LIEVLVHRGTADSALRRLEDLRRVGPDIPKEARPPLDTALQLLRAGRIADARQPLGRFAHVMELTSPYQASLDEVKWLEGPLAGRPVLSFTPKFLGTLRGVARRQGTDLVRFVDATSDAGLPQSAAPVAPTTVAIGDYDGDGTD